MTSTALALNQEKRRVVARALLKQHGLTEWVEDYDAFGLRRHQDAAAFWQKPRIINSTAAARGRNMPTTCAHHFDVIVAGRGCEAAFRPCRRRPAPMLVATRRELRHAATWAIAP